MYYENLRFPTPVEFVKISRAENGFSKENFLLRVFPPESRQLARNKPEPIENFPKNMNFGEKYACTHPSAADCCTPKSKIV
jgi:hypothetical protein